VPPIKFVTILLDQSERNVFHCARKAHVPRVLSALPLTIKRDVNAVLPLKEMDLSFVLSVRKQ
jgi:hypothetical protein